MKYYLGKCPFCGRDIIRYNYMGNPDFISHPKCDEKECWLSDSVMAIEQWENMKNFLPENMDEKHKQLVDYLKEANEPMGRQIKYLWEDPDDEQEEKY
jgi:cytochrome c1